MPWTKTPGRVMVWLFSGTQGRGTSACIHGNPAVAAPDRPPACVAASGGGALLRALIDSTELAGVWTLQTGIFPENAASLALHERFGFRRLGIRERVGKRDGRWRDVVLLERRSSVVGS